MLVSYYIFLISKSECDPQLCWYRGCLSLGGFGILIKLLKSNLWVGLVYLGSTVNDFSLSI